MPFLVEKENKLAYTVSSNADDSLSHLEFKSFGIFQRIKISEVSVFTT